MLLLLLLLWGRSQHCCFPLLEPLDFALLRRLPWRLAPPCHTCMNMAHLLAEEQVRQVGSAHPAPLLVLLLTLMLRLLRLLLQHWWVSRNGAAVWHARWACSIKRRFQKGSGPPTAGLGLPDTRRPARCTSRGGTCFCCTWCRCRCRHNCRSRAASGIVIAAARTPVCATTIFVFGAAAGNVVELTDGL